MSLSLKDDVAVANSSSRGELVRGRESSLKRRARDELAAISSFGGFASNYLKQLWATFWSLLVSKNWSTFFKLQRDRTSSLYALVAIATFPMVCRKVSSGKRVRINK